MILDQRSISYLTSTQVIILRSWNADCKLRVRYVFSGCFFAHSFRCRNCPCKFHTFTHRLDSGAKESAVFRQHASRGGNQGCCWGETLRDGGSGRCACQWIVPWDPDRNSSLLCLRHVASDCKKKQKNLLIHIEERGRWPKMGNVLDSDLIHHVKNSRGWTLARFVVPPRELRKMLWDFVTFSGKFQQTLVLISTQRPDLPLNRDNFLPSRRLG